MKLFWLILFPALLQTTLYCQSPQLKKNMQKETTTDTTNCDIETGICAPPEIAKTNTGEKKIPKVATIIYVGDPMCSWCWGIANELEQLRKEFEENCDFQLVVGGLRPGGGDKWDADFKQFLKKHWEHVHKASGQPFNYDLLKKEYFNYDTEPACRAVRVVRDLASKKEFAFFKAIQSHFYVENEDPNHIDFYQTLCKQLNINFDDFKTKFESEKYKTLVREDFAQSASWGIRGFPSIVLQQGEQLYLISSGYLGFHQMKERIEGIIK